MRPRILLLFLLLFLPSCESQKASDVDITLTDGTNVGGRLVTVDTDWLVLDHVETLDKAQLMLLDYSLVDTLRVFGRSTAQSQGAGAVVGALVGIAAGIFVVGGGSFDSAKLASRGGTRITLGAVAGGLAGGVLGFWGGTLLKDTDMVFPQSTPEDYNFISQFARYPDSIPPNIRTAIDSNAV